MRTGTGESVIAPRTIVEHGRLADARLSGWIANHRWFHTSDNQGIPHEADGGRIVADAAGPGRWYAAMVVLRHIARESADNPMERHRLRSEHCRGRSEIEICKESRRRSVMIGRCRFDDLASSLVKIRIASHRLSPNGGSI